jgi:tetratricopeptide (TPR) repeat protein
MKLFSTCTAVFILSVNLLQAQAGWNWGDNPTTAKEKNAIYNDMMKNNNFKGAVEPLEWLLANTPDLNSAIYINGVKIYDKLQADETDPTQKKAYQSRCLALYDQRIENFGNEAEVLNRKAYKAYKFLRDDKSSYEELYNLFERTFELNGDKVAVNNLVAYMDVIRRYRANGGSLTDDEVLEKYGKTMAILDKNVETFEKAGKDTASLEKNRDFINKMLTGMVKMDCAFIEEKIGPAFESDPSDLDMAKRIIALSLTYNCSKSPIFLKAAVTVQDQEPTFSMAKIIAIKNDAAKNYDMANKYYLEALELATTNQQRADIEYGLANHYRARGMKARSRTSALAAVRSDPSRKEAYKIVGDLYMTSYNDCRQGISKVDDRAVFLAAYKMYERAGDRSGMSNAEKQFPSMEEIFELSLKEGQELKVGCWINETVTLKRRPADT